MYLDITKTSPLVIDAYKSAEKKKFKNMTSQEELAFILNDHAKTPDETFETYFENGHWKSKPFDEDEWNDEEEDE
jgi:hypothetical protein